jgi:hypothetical protein
MIPDENALVVRWISEALGTTRVSATVLPEYEPETGDGFRPEDGPWIVVSCRGGTVHREKVWIVPSMQVRVWAGENQPDIARARYLQVLELLDGAANLDFDVDGYLLLCWNESLGQDLTDADTRYANVNSYFALKLLIQ